MKKQLLLLFALVYCVSSFAQVSKQENELALNLVRANGKTIGLSGNDIDNIVVSSTYQTIADGIRMVYLQQTFKQIPVFNQMQVLAFKNGKLVSLSGGRIQNIDKLSNNSTATITEEDAIDAAIRDCKLQGAAALLQIGQSGSKKIYRDISISSEDITAQLVWLPLSSKEIKLTWEIGLAPLSSPDLWMIRVDASNGKVLDKNNLTVYEKFPDPVNNVQQLTQPGSFTSTQNNLPNSPLVVNSATYRVVPFPVESPQHAGGGPLLVTDPWNFAPGNATSLKWHYDGTTYHDSTRGNNVWAQEDRDNNDNTFGRAAVSTTAQPTLTFDFTPNFTLAPTTLVNQQCATTNLFYWNNIMHDLSYVYGFDEPSGNFQASNQGRGGLGSDYVIADAQDAGGTNNANFGTPVDGTRPRMQMYLFTSTTPNRDGDLDNGVIAHEYTHGISTRLTGGPANSSCLNNAEQGGEGWSDYFALMATTNWTTAQVTDGALAKPMGTYVLGQAVTGAGIRTHPYSTNMSIDSWTYANLAGTGGEVHTIGEIWCTALWEMTWEMIQQDGINPNLFNPAVTGGNSAAMKLVIEGMRLQPCSPGYIDARNAILKADTLFFAAKYSCSIWKAFAKRGMGKGASQGSSNSTTDQVASFVANGGISLLLTQNVTSQQEGLNVTYTNHVSAGVCGALTNYLLTDTLPSNVTYVSGGTYNSGNRVVSFPVNLTAGSNQDYVFTVQINPGSYFPPVSLLNETVAGTTIPATWTATSAVGTSAWAVSTTQSHSATRSFFAVDNSTANTDFRLATNTPIALGAIPPVFTFWHYYNTEPGWDGGVVEISTNGGTNWTDLGSNMTTNGYNGSVGGTNPISGRSAFTGNSGGFIQTKISLLPYANQSALFRFRATSDDNTAATGWYVDDILMNTLAVVNMHTSLFNNSSTIVATSDTFTLIQPSSCITGTIGTHPANTTVCANATANFSITATGTSLTYQWQVSTDGGTNYNNIVGQTNTSLALTGVTVSMNNYKYRCQISGTCTSLTNSNAGTLTVNALPVAPSANNAARCGAGTVTISATAGVGETIDWYTAVSGGSALLSGSASFSTGSINISTTYYAESRNTTTGCVSATRTAVTATVNANPLAPGSVGAGRCGTGTVNIAATAGAGETIDWYAAASGGSALLSGSTSFTTPSISVSTNYFAESRNTTTGCVSATRTAVTATVNVNPVAPGAVGAARCGTGTVVISATAGGGETIDWYAASSGGPALLSGSTSFTTPSISISTTYYAESRNTTTGCVSLTRAAVTATVNPNPITPGGTGASRCGTGTATISATPGAGETIDWYAASSGGSALLSGSASFTTPSINVSTTYYAQARNTTSGCLSFTRTPVTAIVNANPVVPGAVGAARCGTGTVNISATPGAGETIDWYTASTGGSALLSGSTSFTTPSISVSTTYYAESRNTTTGCISATRTAVTATVSTNLAAPGAVNGSRCGTGVVTISATAGAGETIDWYAAASGGSALLSGSTSFTTPSISVPTTYYAESRNAATGCISATRTAVTATVNAIPAAPGAISAARCGTGTVTISATAGAGETIDWYAGPSGGSATLIGSTSFTTPSISVSTTYYAQARNTTVDCISATRTAVTATVNAVPAAPSGSGDFGCGPSNLTVSASPGAGETIDWYAASTGGSALLSGSTSFSTPTISSTTIYYAQARNTTTGCVSATRTAVTATIGNSTNSTTHISICATALPYLWNNNSYNAGGTYTVFLANASGCDSIAKLLLDVGAAINIQTVTGGGSYTNGGVGVPVGLSNSEVGVSYQLLLAGNPIGSPVAGTNAAISFGNQTQQGTYTVFATTALCAQTMSGSATVTIISGPPLQFAVTGGGTYCAGGAGLTVGLAGSQTGVNYQLQRGSGTINVGSPVAGTGAAISFGLQTVASDYSVLATNTVSLATSQMLNSVTIRIASATRAPSAPAAITGPTDACPYMGVSNVTYFVHPAANATSYIWTAPSGASIIGSNTDTTVVIQYPTSFVSGTLSVVSVNACFANATSSARSLAITRKVPSTPGTITASLTNPCSIVGTATNSVYTIRKVTNATGYTWTLPTGITFISNLGDTGVVVKFENGFATGAISVVAYNNCATSAARTLTVTATAPSTPAAISGPTNVCAFIGQPTNAAFSITAVTNATSYLWTAPANATIVSGQGTISVQVSFGAAFASGSLTVKSVSGCGSSSARSLSLVKNIAKPGAISASATACPSTDVTYTIAAVPFATSYIWSVPTNATYVSGQGTTSFTVSYKPVFVSGTVTVKSVNNCSTSAVSSLAVAASGCRPAVFAGSKGGVDPAVVVKEEEIGIYPNPSNGVFKINFNAAGTSGNVTIQLVNMYGKVVLQQKAAVNANGTVSATVNAQNILAGIYEVRYNNGKAVNAQKLVIVK